VGGRLRASAQLERAAAPGKWRGAAAGAEQKRHEERRADIEMALCTQIEQARAVESGQAEPYGTASEPWLSASRLSMERRLGP